MTTKADTLVAKTVEAVQQTFVSRLIAAYIIGSLARGGFSEHYSDIDLAFILAGPLTESDQHAFQNILKRLSILNIPFANKLSLFWQSAANLNESFRTDNYAHSSAFDQIDLFQYGLLKYGVDVRTNGFQFPSQRSLEIDAVNIALEKLNNPRVIAMMANPHLLFSQRTMPPSKLVLLPVRLIYTALTHKTGSNKDAVDYYCRYYADNTVHLVESAFKWRQQLPDIHHIDLDLIKKNLPIIYHRLIMIYREKMQVALKNDLVQSLSQWENTLQKTLISEETSAFLSPQGVIILP